MSLGTVNYTEQDVATVAVTTTVVLAANPDRHYASFKNVSAQQISLKFGEDAVVEEGTVLEAGESYEMSEQIGNLELGQVNAISTGGQADLAYVEAETP